jgi:hypothetical protein
MYLKSFSPFILLNIKYAANKEVNIYGIAKMIGNKISSFLLTKKSANKRNIVKDLFAILMNKKYLNELKD